MYAMYLNLKFQGKCRLEIVNVGGCGYGTHRLIPVVAEMLSYEPDVIWFHEANNEFEEVEQLQFAYPWTVPLQRLLFKSAFCRFVRDRLVSGRLSRFQRAKNQQLLGLPPEQNGSWERKEYTPAQIGERMQVFKKNLRLIVEMCKNRNVPLILSTVPSNLCKPRLNDQATADRIREYFNAGCFEEGERYAREVLRTSARHQASDTENNIIRKVAAECGIPLADVEARIIAAEPHHVPGETLFEDHCHLNSDGRWIFIETFIEQLLKILEARMQVR